MTDFPGFIENAMAGDNVEGSPQDENVILYSHWQRICAAGIAAASVVCIAWLQLAGAGSQPSADSGKTKRKRKAEGSGTTKMKRKATADLIPQSVGKDIVSSLDNVSRAIIKSAEILANKMPCPYDRNKKVFTSLEAFELSEEYLIETKMKSKATADVILRSVGKDIVSSLDNVSRAIIISAEILANKMPCPYDRYKKLFASLEALELSKEYLIECYYYLSMHEAAANKFLGVPQQFRKEMLKRIMISASLSK